VESFVVGALFGIFGMAYFYYGKKRDNKVALVSGVILCVYPYFIDSVPLLIGIGIVLVVVPFVYKG
jgi:predicted membrane-bound dolichyl-phosphate-mannose-protein mannosyltransferase